MLTDTLIQIYDRDLNKLKAEIELYADEAELWKKSGEITNSAGNLALHLVGNLKHFFGAVLGNTAYVRDRDREFSDTGISRSEILHSIDETSSVVKATLASLTADGLAKTYPIEVFGHPMTTEYFIVHLAGHLTWHLGQINYHRRILEGA